MAALEADGHDVLDLGTFSTDPVDYPDYARAVGQAVLRGFVDAGVLLCGSGVGASIAANKIRGIRAALCHDADAARRSREEDDANVLCLAARGLEPEDRHRDRPGLASGPVLRRASAHVAPGGQDRPARGRPAVPEPTRRREAGGRGRSRPGHRAPAPAPIERPRAPRRARAARRVEAATETARRRRRPAADDARPRRPRRRRRRCPRTRLQARPRWRRRWTPSRPRTSSTASG